MHEKLMPYTMELTAVALVGTARAELPAVPAGPLANLMGQAAGMTPERRLLTASALAFLWEQAGLEPSPATEGELTSAPSEERQPCPAAAERLLARMIRGDLSQVLPEALDRLAAGGFFLPHRWLPELLDLARRNNTLRPAIVAAMGRRGCWLAGQNPDWQELVASFEGVDITGIWETGSSATRLALLRHLRQTEPACAWDLLESVWEEESAPTRAAFLAELAAGLSPADEPFLEIALNDRSKQVRMAAADLLARLPASGLVKRMRERLTRLLSLERGFLGRTKLRLALPEQCDAAMNRDGIETHSLPGLGQRAGWLLQMLSRVPPATWSELWQKSPEELLRLAGGTEYEAVLLQGWAAAAGRSQDPAWAEALVRRWFTAPWPAAGSAPANIADLVACVPETRLEPWLAGQLHDLRSPDDRPATLALLQEVRRPWGEPLTRALLDFLRRSTGQTDQPGLWRWRLALPDFALYACPALVEEAERDWPEDHPWQSNLETFTTILRFRYELQEALP